MGIITSQELALAKSVAAEHSRVIGVKWLLWLLGKFRGLDIAEEIRIAEEPKPDPQTEPGPPPDKQWWVLNGGCFLQAMKRAHDGEDPDLLYLEYWAESETENV